MIIGMPLFQFLLVVVAIVVVVVCYFNNFLFIFFSVEFFSCVSMFSVQKQRLSLNCISRTLFSTSSGLEKKRLKKKLIRWNFLVIPGTVTYILDTCNTTFAYHRIVSYVEKLKYTTYRIESVVGQTWPMIVCDCRIQKSFIVVYGRFFLNGPNIRNNTKIQNVISCVQLNTLSYSI